MKNRFIFKLEIKLLNVSVDLYFATITSPSLRIIHTCAIILFDSPLILMVDRPCVVSLLLSRVLAHSGITVVFRSTLICHNKSDVKIPDRVRIDRWCRRGDNAEMKPA